MSKWIPCLTIFILLCSFESEGSLCEESRNFFTFLDSDQTQIDFSNELRNSGIFNKYTNRNFYNGGDVAIAVINQDGWKDIFVNNDFFERDYLYLYNQGGEFQEVLDSIAGEVSLSSIGADITDINNDRFPDLVLTEMFPQDKGRLKTKTTFEDWNKYPAGYRGTVLQDMGDVTFNFIDPGHSGVYITGDVRNIKKLSLSNDSWFYIVSRLDDSPLTLTITNIDYE